MSQNAERARAIKLARKLMDQTTTRGRTEGEMDQAMAQLAKIKSTYDLTLDEIVLNTLEYKQLDVDAIAVKGCPMKDTISSIALFTDTKRWQSDGKKKTVSGYTPRGYYCYKRVSIAPGQYHFFGLESDIQMAEFLYTMIAKSLETASEAFKISVEYQNLTGRRGAKKSAMYTFRHTFCQRVASRLSEMYYTQERIERSARKAAGIEAGTNDITVCRKQIRESKFDEQTGIKLVSVKSYGHGGNSRVGSNAGYSSANNVNLSVPVNAPNSARTLALA